MWDNGIRPSRVLILGLTIGIAVYAIPTALFGAQSSALCLMLGLMSVPVSMVMVMFTAKRAERIPEVQSSLGHRTEEGMGLAA